LHPTATLLPKARLATSAVHGDAVAQIKMARTTHARDRGDHRERADNFATFGKKACIAVAKYGACLPLRNLQVVDISAIGETEAI